MTDTKPPEKTPETKDNALVNILFNVVIPVFILNKGSERLGAPTALLLALAFPIAFGIWDSRRRKQINMISVLGVINVSITGGLALTGLGGLWFCAKEAAFPALIGAFVAFTAWGKKPFIQTMLINPQAMNIDLIDQKISERGAQNEFQSLLKKSTLMLAASFFVSSILNYIVALRVFLPFESSLSSEAKAQILNQQIAQMTSLSLLSIMLPSMIILMLVLFYLLNRLGKITGLTMNELMKS
jgi:hypothetical protein